jgi:hypothetical protein
MVELADSDFVSQPLSDIILKTANISLLPMAKKVVCVNCRGAHVAGDQKKSSAREAD